MGNASVTSSSEDTKPGVPTVVSGVQDLIARLEKATGPNFELERRIAEVMGLAATYTRGRSFPVLTLYGGRTTPLPYTASIDAAVSLLGGLWCIFAMESPSVKYLPVNANGSFIGAPEFEVHVHANIPIALCIAALKARLHQLQVGTPDQAEAPSSKSNQ